jgi:hypothetical protein
MMKSLSPANVALLHLLIFSSLLGEGFSFHNNNGIIGLSTLKRHRPAPSSCHNMVSLSQDGSSTETTPATKDTTAKDNNQKKKVKVGLASDTFLKEYFNSDIDDINLPPSLSIIKRSIGQLAQGSDIRGRFIPNHHVPSASSSASASSSSRRQQRSFASLAHDIGQSPIPALTPFAAHCLGYAFGMMVREEKMEQQQREGDSNKDDGPVTICIGRDPREHGVELADAFSRGAGGVPNVRVTYTGIATTPAMFEFCRYVLSIMDNSLGSTHCCYFLLVRYLRPLS